MVALAAEEAIEDQWGGQGFASHEERAPRVQVKEDDGAGQPFSPSRAGSLHLSQRKPQERASRQSRNPRRHLNRGARQALGHR